MQNTSRDILHRASLERNSLNKMANILVKFATLNMKRKIMEILEDKSGYFIVTDLLRLLQELVTVRSSLVHYQRICIDKDLQRFDL